MAKLPNPPRTKELARPAPKTVVPTTGTLLSRDYFRGGVYPANWSEFRPSGHLAGARFDHGVLYAAVLIEMWAAEVLQGARSARVWKKELYLVGFSLAVPSRCLT